MFYFFYKINTSKILFQLSASKIYLRMKSPNWSYSGWLFISCYFHPFNIIFWAYKYEKLFSPTHIWVFLTSKHGDLQRKERILSSSFWQWMPFISYFSIIVLQGCPLNSGYANDTLCQTFQVGEEENSSKLTKYFVDVKKKHEVLN